MEEIRSDKADEVLNEYDGYMARALQKIFDFSKVDAELEFYVADRSIWTGYFDGDDYHSYKVVVNRQTKHMTVFPVGNLDHL
jgi:hypothetical protein